jgi:predicted Zn finger-like uncharacterized protein
MSMITRCPACETMFKVVPDQLRISAGWVRCGQCDEIFDASAHLMDGELIVRSPVVDPLAGVLSANEMLANAPPAPPAPLESSSLPEQSLTSEQPLRYSSDFEELDLNLEEVATESEPSQGPSVEAEVSVLDSRGLGDVIEVSEPAVSIGMAEPEGALDETEKVGLTVFELLPEPISFLSSEGEVSVRRRLAWRWFLAVVSLLLLLALMAQGVYRERNSLAAQEPRLGPWLERACDAIGCVLSPIQRIDSISVDSSTFTKLRAETYRLSFSLKNSASTPVAFPSIELTLTDALDRPLLRRVLRASDVGSTVIFLDAGAEWPASIDMAVQSSAIPDRVAGYRLVAFYP